MGINLVIQIIGIIHVSQVREIKFVEQYKK